MTEAIAPPAPPPLPRDLVAPPRRAGPSIGWAYAVAAAAMALLLLVVMNPAFGEVARAWPWDVETPGRWSPEGAAIFVLGTATLALLACAFLRPGRGRAVVGLFASLLPIVALKTGHDYFLGVVVYAGPVLAAVLAGALYGALGVEGRRAGGQVVATAVLVLAALLFYPLYAEPGQDGGTITYTSWLLDVLGNVETIAKEGEPGDLRHFLLHPPTTLILSYAVLAVLGALAALSRSRALAWACVAVFALTVLWPVGYPFLDALADPEFHRGSQAELATLSAGEIGVRLAGLSLLHYFLPAVVGAFAVTADLVRGRATRVATPVAPVGPPAGRQDR